MKARKLDPDREPFVGNDPMSLPQLGEKKETVAPDPERVEEARRKRKEPHREHVPPRPDESG
jgi:hypothetical protein